MSEKPSHKNPNGGTVGETTTRGLEFGVVAVVIAIVVLIPIVLDPIMVIYSPEQGYFPAKFRVLMGFSAVLLVAVLGVALLRRKSLGVLVLVPALSLLGVSTLSTILSEDPLYSLYGDRDEGLLSWLRGSCSSTRRQGP